MVQKIIWSNLALKTYLSNIEYLEKAWSQKEIDHFIDATEKKLKTLQLQPRIGRATNKRRNVRRVLIVKRVLLIYRHKPQKNTIELLQFFSTWQHPDKMAH